ncbi:MAG: tetratricopeptide repeat protein [Planctomycetes bacterium]|nr:tetratricopeptide repeat protein [Planctomycetota bacterium]MBL7188127.1 tetratricopeptide repeat protein [Phycisphaerae bacterium]
MKTKQPIAIVALVGTIIGLSVHGCKDSKNAGAYYNQGIARLEKGENDAAISDLTKAIKMRPRFAMAHFYRGRAYLGKGEHDKALSDLTEAIELDPALAVAYGERAVIHFIRKEYDKVWENIHKQESLGLQANPGFLKALREASGRKK